MVGKVILSRLPLRYSGKPLSFLRHPHIDVHGQTVRQARYASTTGKALTEDEIEELFSKPTWSVSSLVRQEKDLAESEIITSKQLHHLLRLSALPLPETPGEESKMIEILQSQLHFVRTIQSIDTTGVKPLHAIRDETSQARQALQFDVESLKDEFEKDDVVGFARRIRRKPGTAATQDEDMVDVLKLAPNKVGRYVVVNTKKT